MGAIVVKFLKYFICKWLGTKAVEKVLIITLGELVKRTDSDIDDKIFEAIFGKQGVEDGGNTK
ncbi:MULTISPECIES: hypothetical protein [Fusobacterium]|jgi:hypothetical protein|uniref:hypothetical protein n=1 Tax=Fusobacterium TaxID=848 RepID=UPI000E82EA1E|nr:MULTISPECIES: hypothetical protein [Fusobacterium]DAE77841.1 MAG TPA: hypothetical protein [Caudoviricetes sp.]HBJ79715.1 hypothetical protein [Fusobacterium sp.]